jgi:hypothetical protein
MPQPIDWRHVRDTAIAFLVWTAGVVIGCRQVIRNTPWPRNIGAVLGVFVVWTITVLLFDGMRDR